MPNEIVQLWKCNRTNVEIMENAGIKILVREKHISVNGIVARARHFSHFNMVKIYKHSPHFGLRKQWKSKCCLFAFITLRKTPKFSNTKFYSDLILFEF